MSNVKVVLTAMRTSQTYRICDIAAITNISQNDVDWIIKELLKGGLVEEVTYNSYKKTREKKYKTKQNEFNLGD